MRTFLKNWGPVLLWMGFIFWMSTDSFSGENTSRIIKPLIQFLLPGAASATVDMIHTAIRKCGHVTEYFILGLLLFHAFRLNSRGKERVWHWAILSLLAGMLYAAGDEFHQSFTVMRGASPIDVGIDTAGGMLAQVASVVWYFFKKKTT